jgi:hypothetical protein
LFLIFFICRIQKHGALLLAEEQSSDAMERAEEAERLYQEAMEKIEVSEEEILFHGFH